MRNKFDIFISYRREEGKDIARVLKESLEKKGYRVFLDMDELQDGVFDKRILEAIHSAPVFMLIMTEHALDRCINEQDWVRQEIEYALSTHRHIIPINPDRQFQKYSDNVPPQIVSELKQYQYSAIDTCQLYQESIDKLDRERLQPILRTHWWKWILLALAIISLGLGGFYGTSAIQHQRYIDHCIAAGDKFDSVQLYTQGYDSAVDSAFYFYHLGALAGDPYCQYKTASLLSSMFSANQDIDSAFYWAQKAYDAHYVDAATLLGCFYFDGTGVPVDKYKGIEYFKEGAENGDFFAQYQMGLILRQGKLIPRDFVQGSYYLVQAAQQGDVASRITLGAHKTWVFYPKLDSVTDPLVTIKALSWSEDDTLQLYCEWHNKRDGWMQINPNAYVQNARTSERYPISDVTNCAFYPDTTPVAFGHKHFFTLSFPHVPDTISSLNFLDSDTADWQFYGIHIEDKIHL